MIHVVRAGETMTSIAAQYQISPWLLAAENGLNDPSRLVVGQALLVLIPERLYVGEQDISLAELGQIYGVSPRQLRRLNPWLAGGDALPAGVLAVIAYTEGPGPAWLFNGYAYPFIDRELLRTALPYLTALQPFTYGFTAAGRLIPLDDGEMLAAAAAAGTPSLLVLAPLGADGRFSNELITAVLNNAASREQLISEIILTVEERGYLGVDLDFEYVPATEGPEYVAFAAQLADVLHRAGKALTIALAPKYYAEQRGALYEGHDYNELGRVADYVLLMTYEWGYTYGPPLAVAPLYEVRRVVEYGLSEIPGRKILLGLPNYGYDWTLPYVQGRAAQSISNPRAVELAWENRAAINYDEAAASPWFRYYTPEGEEHEVWFEDVRSWQAKFDLGIELGLAGASFWTVSRPNTPGWLLSAVRFAPGSLNIQG